MKHCYTASQSGRPTRWGGSLVEIVVTMTIGSSVLALGIGTLHLLLRTDKNLVDSLQRSGTVSRLSETFRQDAHAARSVKLEPRQAQTDPAGLTFVLSPEHQVRYSVQTESLIRTETEGENILQTERFRFSEGTTISLQTPTETKAAVLIRSINPQQLRGYGPQTAVPLRDLNIEAIVARDHRFAGK